MAYNLGTAKIDVVVDQDKALAGLKAMENKFRDAGEGLKKFGELLTKAILLPSIALGGLSLKKYYDSNVKGSEEFRKSVDKLRFAWDTFLGRVAIAITRDRQFNELIRKLTQYINQLDFEKIKKGLAIFKDVAIVAGISLVVGKFFVLTAEAIKFGDALKEVYKWLKAIAAAKTISAVATGSNIAAGVASGAGATGANGAQTAKFISSGSIFFTKGLASLAYIGAILFAAYGIWKGLNGLFQSLGLSRLQRTAIEAPSDRNRQMTDAEIKAENKRIVANLPSIDYLKLREETSAAEISSYSRRLTNIITEFFGQAVYDAATLQDQSLERAKQTNQMILDEADRTENKFKKKLKFISDTINPPNLTPVKGQFTGFADVVKQAQFDVFDQQNKAMEAAQKQWEEEQKRNKILDDTYAQGERGLQAMQRTVEILQAIKDGQNVGTGVFVK